MSNETTFTEIFVRNLWGCDQTRSGPTATLERTRELRELFPELLRSLGIESILDVGCGDWNWMRTVDLTGVNYLGVDIVTTLVESLQQSHTADTVNFQKMDVLREPPETADLWLARDLLCVLDYAGIHAFFEKFLESKSLYLAVTTVETNAENADSVPGICRMLDLFQQPFQIKNPTKILPDGEEWFRPKFLLVYPRDEIATWFQHNSHKFRPPRPEGPPPYMADGTQDRNAHLTANIPLRSYPTHGHMVLPRSIPSQDPPS